MHDALGAGDGRLDSLTCDQITTCILDALGGHVALPAEHSHAMPGVAQPRNDEPPEATGAAGNWKLFSKKIGKVAGRHDVFIKFPAGDPRSMYIKTIRFVHN